MWRPYGVCVAAARGHPLNGFAAGAAGFPLGARRLHHPVRLTRSRLETGLPGQGPGRAEGPAASPDEIDLSFYIDDESDASRPPQATPGVLPGGQRGGGG